MTERLIVMGAAGRDFHNFLAFFKRSRRYRVVAFTVAQIPGIAGRTFPAGLAGRRYPYGIPIHPEAELGPLIRKLRADTVCLSYSDLSHQEVMDKASRVLAAGANFLLLGPRDTMVPSVRPVIAVSAARTGCGKSQTARALAEELRRRGRRVVGIRHSMPYGRDLEAQACQRFAGVADFARHHTTIEEEEEYQPWLDHGFAVYAGFDYVRILRAAEREADVLIFDGGNNDLPLVRPDLHVTVVDPHRAGHEATYYPGFVNLLLADVVVVNKVDSAAPEAVARVVAAVRAHNPRAIVVKARSELRVDHPERIRGRRCAVIGDGPTLSHGGMGFGAGTLAVRRHGGRIVDPRRWLAGSLRATYRNFPHLALEIPAMGYSDAQVRDLARTVNAIPCDTVVDGSPADLQRLIRFARPVVNVRYELDTRSARRLGRILAERGLT